MIRMATPLFLLAGLFVLTPVVAGAQTEAGGLKKMLGAARVTDTIVIPQEWGGIWTSVDSTYDCSGAFDFVDGSVDTLCPGVVVVDPGFFPVVFLCNGSATATTVDVDCTGGVELFPGCVANYTYSIHGTRSGDEYFVVSTTEISYSGSAEGCDLIPPSCTQVNSHGTRTGPVPIEYCQTPARPSSWGRLKVRYR